MFFPSVLVVLLRLNCNLPNYSKLTVHKIGGETTHVDFKSFISQNNVSFVLTTIFVYIFHLYVVWV